MERSETRAIAVIAMPLIGAYLAEFAMAVISKVVVGRLGHVPLAGAGLSEDLVAELLVVLMGLLSVVGVLAAEREGQRDPAGVAHRIRQGMLLALLVAVPATFAVWHLAALLPWLGQAPEVVGEARAYLRALAPVVLPVLWFAVLRYFAAAIGRTRPILLVTLLAVGVKALLTWGLVLGQFGLPRIGASGAAWATSLANWFMFLAMSGIVLLDPKFRRYPLWRGLPGFDRALWSEILRLGAPVALIVVLEGGLFAAVQILMGVFGARSLAANQIVLAWVSCAFVIVLGLAEATMFRVAQGSGRGDPAAARATGLTGIGLAVAVMAALALVPILFPERIVGLFLEADDPARPAVSALASTLFVIGALFGVFDGLQAVSARALRGIRDTVVPLWLASVGYWVVGLGGGALLAFPLGFGEQGLWWGLATGLMVTGVALAGRFVLLTGRTARGP